MKDESIRVPIESQSKRIITFDPQDELLTAYSHGFWPANRMNLAG